MNMQEDIINRLSKLIVSVNTPLIEALNKMDETGIGILLICGPQKELLGILTDGDIRRYLLRGQSMDSAVSVLMNKDFFALREPEKEKAYELLRKNKFSHVPILDGEGKVVDLITSWDLLKDERRLYTNPVVIMAGGKGDRLSPLTKIIPKPLIPIGDKTMIEMIIENFHNTGFSDFKIIVNYKKELIKAYIEENKINCDYNIVFLEEDKYMGTAGGLSFLKGVIDDTFILSNCDILVELDYGRMLDWHKEHMVSLTLLGVRKKINVPYGVIKVNSENYVTDIDEKPDYTFMIVSGVYIMEPSVLDSIPENSFYDMDTLLKTLISNGQKVTCYPVEHGWFDIGQIEEYKNLLRHYGELSI
jgi:dTDP-glucose pyrophosphorylase/CBS domain-containing protein